MRRAIAIACGVLVLAGLLAGWPGDIARETGPVPAVEAAPPAPSRLPDALHGRGPYEVPPPPPPPTVRDEVREAIRSSYYRFVPQHVLSLPTVGSMLAALDDPYTEYLHPEHYQELREELARTYFGVGLTVGLGADGLIVTSSLDGPARAAGIEVGDVIISIDGQPAAKLSFEDSTALIKGEKGTVVHLTVQRPGTERPIEFTVVRREIEQPSVKSRLLRSQGHKLGYIRVLSFREDVAERVGAAVRRLVDKGADGFVLDLRGDPGGLLEQAIELTSIFLAEGRVCSTSSLHETRSYFVSGSPIETERPLALLVDGETASAAEIVAAALAENERATLLGRRTFGKASVQTIMELSNGGALKLTTATYLTPRGTSIRERGIRPEIRVSDDPETRPDEAVIEALSVLSSELHGG